MYLNVLITKPLNNTFTYICKEKTNIKEGDVVLVPFGKKNEEIGIVYEIFKSRPKNLSKVKLRTINHVYKNLKLSKKIIDFIEWISNYTLAPRGMVLKLFLVNKKIIKINKIDKKHLINFKKIELNSNQKSAFKIIKKFLTTEFKPIVLEGVTGSGKTEVYFEAIENILNLKKQILILLPEISLTPQFEKRFLDRFGFLPEVWHSKITDKKRNQTWNVCINGNPSVVIGTRSSLFLPFKSIGLIVVDEEHDMSFKQEDNIRYHARDLAIVKAKIERIPIILSSATPSLETINNINQKNYTHLYLPEQYSGIDLPSIELIDLNKEKLESNKWVSKKIINTVFECIKKGEQALLFLNRRGYSPLTICSKCGYRYQCNHCSSWLVLHKQKNRLLCHHCGSIYDNLEHCFKCNEKDSLKLIGPGIERLEEEIKNYFPKNKIQVMSSDNANTTNKLKKIIDNFENKNIDILIATQIMAKGYHFPNLSLVGVIDADAGLIGGDLRAMERTYNLLQQVSGRAGRSKKSGKVLIQTYYPDQGLIKAFTNRDRETFVKECLKERKLFNMPPFSYMTAIIISSQSKINAKSYANLLVSKSPVNQDIQFLGPMEAPIFLLRGKYRFRLLLKGNKRKTLNDFTRDLLMKYPPSSSVRLTVDVDPYTFM